jgi:hypothetical protein
MSLMLLVSCGGSGSETPPPLEPMAPAYPDEESASESQVVPAAPIESAEPTEDWEPSEDVD